MKLDQHQLGLKRIKVAISNPPKRAAAMPLHQFGHNNEGEIPAVKGSDGGGGGGGGGAWWWWWW